MKALTLKYQIQKTEKLKERTVFGEANIAILENQVLAILIV